MGNIIPKLRVASDNQLLALHQASLNILENTGVDFFNEEAVGLFQNAGAIVEGSRVKIPSALVEKALQVTPRELTMYDRSGIAAIRLMGDNVYFGTGSDTPHLIDPYTGERRQPLKEDIRLMARLVDGLPNISFMMCMGIASDVNEKTSDVHHFEAMVTNTKKPIIFTAWDLAGLKDIYEMCVAIAGDEETFEAKPFAALYAMPTAPLRHMAEVCEQILFCADKRLPLVYVGGPLLGATSPVTLAGGLAQLNAEFLSGLVLAQLKRPGAVVIHGGATCPLDFRSMTMSIAAPEVSLGYAFLKELASYYHLPIFTLAGCTDSKIVDQQAAMEAAFSITVACLSGQHLVHDVGYIEGGQTASFEMVALGDEIIAMARRLKSGFKLNIDTLGLDAINKVGPGGTFVEDEHTLRFFRTEIWYPTILDRRTYRAWQEDGSKDLGQRLREKVQSILSEHRPEPLPSHIHAKLETMVKRSECRYREIKTQAV